MQYRKPNVFITVHANSLDPFVPELWANESLAILEENMVIAQLVHRDFENEVRNFGDVVNTRRPGEFTALRKTVSDNVTKQDATATNVQVPLNQHVHTSFIIKDGEQSLSFKDLVATYMNPAMLAQARFIDRILLGQTPQFLGNKAGALGSITSSNAKDYILSTRNKLNVNKAYMENRRLIVTPNTETALLKLDLFTSAEQVGDNGTALREASLGRKLGFDIFMCQNMSSVIAGNSTVTGAVNNAAGYPAGTTTMTVDGLSAALPVGSYFTVAGDMTPLQIVSSVGGATPTSVTFTPALSSAVVDDAVLTRYVPGAVNQSVSPTGYAAGYAKEIVVDAFTVAPQIGQIVTFGASTTTAKYTIIGVTGLTGITLDRPLEAAIADDAAVNIGPRGEYNLAFHRNALALVCRPLALPMPGAGARAAVINSRNLSMRATIAYLAEAQGHLVTLDLLCGVAVLDTNLGAVMLG